VFGTTLEGVIRAGDGGFFHEVKKGLILYNILLVNGTFILFLRDSNPYGLGLNVGQSFVSLA